MLIHPQSQLIREPRLLVPGRQPLGPVKVDKTNQIGKKVGDFIIPNHHGGHADYALVGGSKGAALRCINGVNYGINFIKTPSVPYPFTFGCVIDLYEINTTTSLYNQNTTATSSLGVRINSSNQLQIDWSEYGGEADNVSLTTGKNILLVTGESQGGSAQFAANGKLNRSFTMPSITCPTPNAAKFGSASTSPVDRVAQGFSFKGNVELAFWSQYAFTGIECLAWMSDPYQFLCPS